MGKVNACAREGGVASIEIGSSERMARATGTLLVAVNRVGVVTRHLRYFAALGAMLAGTGCGGQIGAAHGASGDAAAESSSSDASSSGDVTVANDSATIADTGVISFEAGAKSEGGVACDACTGTCCDTTCIDTQTDGSNCGACGHSCLGGACIKGLCQAFRIAPVPSGFSGEALTLDANNVYYATFQGSLYTCPKTGCTAPTTLTTGLNNPGAMVYDSLSNEIFVADTYNNAVEAYTTTGTEVFRVASSGSNPTALAVDATSLYWSVVGGVVKSTKDGKTQTQIVSGIAANDQISWVTLDPSGASLYGGLINPGALFSAPTNSAGAWSYFAGTASGQQPVVNEVLAQGSNVTWITDYGSDGGAGGIFTCPSTGCSSPTAVPGASPLQYGGVCLFVDATNIHYVAYNGYSANFYVCPVGGCPGGATLLVSNILPVGAGACAEDATSYYFLETADLLRLAK